MKALEAAHVAHAYATGSAKTPVLKDFSLALETGAFTALMGPSGSGKSTFLHLAAGLLVPDAGRIDVGGTDVTALSDAAAAKFRRRRTGVVFQAFNLVETLTVAENIALPAALDGKKADKARLAELVANLALAGLEKKFPAELSGGERQRVAIARALYMKPDVVLADEPTGNLDAASARAVCALLRELNASEKTAILLVTHDPVVAASATDVVFLKDGACVASFPTAHDPAVVSQRYLETFG